MIAGFVDAYGMITYGVYVSFMSGNTTQTGYQAAEGAFGPACALGAGDPVLRRRIVRRDLAGRVRGRFARRVLYCVVAAALAAIVGLAQFGLLSGAGADRGDKFRDGSDEQRALPRWRASRKPDFRHGQPEPRRIVSRIGAEARAPSRRAGTVGHPSAPRAPARSTLGSASWSARCCRERPRPATARWSYRRRR